MIIEWSVSLPLPAQMWVRSLASPRTTSWVPFNTTPLSNTGKGSTSSSSTRWGREEGTEGESGKGSSIPGGSGLKSLPVFQPECSGLLQGEDQKYLRSEEDQGILVETLASLSAYLLAGIEEAFNIHATASWEAPASEGGEVVATSSLSDHKSSHACIYSILSSLFSTLLVPFPFLMNHS